MPLAPRPTVVLPAVLGFLSFLLLLPGPRSGSTSESAATCTTHLGWVDPLGPLSCHRPAVAAFGVVVWLVSRQALAWWHTGA